MARPPYITNWHWKYGNKEWDSADMYGYYPVSIYKDTTGQYTDYECDLDNCVEIPVPVELLTMWFKDSSCWNQQVADEILEDLGNWVFRESTCDETCDLYSWLCSHGYYWKRLKKEGA